MIIWPQVSRLTTRCAVPPLLLHIFPSIYIIRFIMITVHYRGWDSSVGTVTGYGLDGQGSNPGGGEIFRICPDRPWGPPSLLYNGYWVIPEGKAARA
jgi:hypothetical protein